MNTKVRKTFNVAGKWVERPTRSTILVCACGNKYIKTKPIQTVCIRCMAKLLVR